MVKYGFLHCHSEYSLHDSTATPKELVAQAKAMGAESITLTDHGTMLGIEPFMKAGKEMGVNTIPGMEIYLENKEHFLLVARDYTGYQMLSKLLRKAKYVEIRKRTYPLVPYQVLETMEGKEHLLASSACVQGPLSQILLANKKIEKEIAKKERVLTQLFPCKERYEAAEQRLSRLEDELSYQKAKQKSYKQILSPKFAKELAKKEKDCQQISLFQEEKTQELKAMKSRFAYVKTQSALCKTKIKELEEEIKEVNTIKKSEKSSMEKYNKSMEFIETLKKSLIPEHELYEKAKFLAQKYAALFPYFYIELQNHGLEMEKTAYPLLAAIAKECHIPVIAANDAHMVDASADSLEARRLMRFNYFGRHQELSPYDKEMYLKSDEELSAALRKILDEETVREAMESLSILSTCRVALPEEKHYPKAPGKDSFDTLLREARKKMIARGKWDEEHESRLTHEVSVIKQMGFVDYHMVVRDFCMMGRKLGVVPKEERKNIPDDFTNIDRWLEERHYTVGEGIGPGRGSAAGSLVCYLLGITNIDPVKYNLLFERFLNPERVTMPDIDTDVATSLRQTLIRYLYWEYGWDAISFITTETTYGAKGAIQAVGRDEADRLYGNLPLKEKNKAKSQFMHQYVFPVSDSLTDPAAKVSDVQMEAFNPISQAIVKKAALIEGKLFATGIHAGGVVISDNGDISEYLPTYHNTVNDLEVWAVQCDMVRLEEKGFLKVDLLGLKTLDVNSDTLCLIQKHEGISINLDTIPFEAEVFSEIYAKGFTNSVFQFESEGMKKMLRQFRPTCFEDIILLVAAYRPGPMQYLDDIIKVKQGVHPAQYAIPELEPILSVTYGAVIYQEQVMRIFQDLAGYSLGGADLVRRAMSKKKLDVLEKERKAFIYGDASRQIAGCVANGIPQDKADQLFDNLIDFAKYAFNKSHAASYALVSYQTAWLKYHYPVYFACAMLNNEVQKDYGPILDDCRVSSISILPPSILQSFYDFTVENGCIRFGFRGIKGIAEKTQGTIDRLKHAREEKEIISFSDFYRYVCVTITPDDKVRQVPVEFMDKIIDVGMFDAFCKNRQSLSFAYHETAKKISALRGEQKEGKISIILQQMSIAAPEMADRNYNMKKEKEYLGGVYSENPLAGYGPPQTYGCVPIAQMKQGNNKVMGYISTITERTSKKGTPLWILTFCGTEDNISILAMQKYFPNLEQYLFRGVVITVRRGEKGLFMENIRYLSPSTKQSETVFFCDTVEKCQLLGEILQEMDREEIRYCIVHILCFIDKKTLQKMSVPITKTIMVTEKAFQKLDEKPKRERVSDRIL